MRRRRGRQFGAAGRPAPADGMRWIDLKQVMEYFAVRNGGGACARGEARSSSSAPAPRMGALPASVWLEREGMRTANSDRAPGLVSVHPGRPAGEH